MEQGLFDNYEAPEWITVKQATDIQNELLQYIQTQWTQNRSQLKNLKLKTDELLKMLKCLGEDLIFDKYGIEMEQVYKFLQNL